MRIIDADKLHPDCMTKNGTLAISQSQIANAPTLPNPCGNLCNFIQPTGYWIYNPDCINDEMQSEFYCSNCNHGADSTLSNYCPNCGAKMQSGEWMINGIDNLIDRK